MTSKQATLRGAGEAPPDGQIHSESRILNESGAGSGTETGRVAFATLEGTQTRSTDEEYGFEIQPFKGRVTATVNGVKLASTENALLLTETRLAPVYYFPLEDVRTDLMTASEQHTHCPFRGNASYWSVAVGDQVIANAAWSYEQPLHDARRIRGYIAFAPDALDEPGVQTRYSQAVVPSNYPNPLVDWVLHRGPNARSIVELLEQFTEIADVASIPLWRVWLAVPTLHPQLFSMSYSWQRPDQDKDANLGGIVERTIHHGLLQEDRFLNSPLKPILEGAGGVRQRLEGSDPDLDFPVVRDHRRAGATDYVAMPVTFTDGQINALSLTTKRPGGFSTRDLGFIYEVLPSFSRLLEVHAARRNSVSLLRTYLGRQTGERVLNGLVKRGDRDRINAVIWFCDLRDSTQLAESLSSDEYIDTLNQFYDCVAHPVLQHGGEVLRYIGDAALAIFPISESADLPKAATAAACVQALAAVEAARERITEANLDRGERQIPRLRFGLGLHVGELTYGNIGTADRLEFTVIGPAANEAARLQDLCKTLGHSVLVSQSFVDAFELAGETEATRFEKIGDQELRGIRERMAVYAVP